jgi:hypothetical protein
MKSTTFALALLLAHTAPALAENKCSAAADAYAQARAVIDPGPDACEATLKEALAGMKTARDAAESCGCAPLSDDMGRFLARLRSSDASCFDKSQDIMLYDAQFADLIADCR